MPANPNLDEVQEVTFDFDPRPYQLEPLVAWHNGIRFIVLVWHRRAGKDLTLFNLLIPAAMKRVGAYYYFFPTFAQGKKIVWDGRTKDGVRFRDYFPKDLIYAVNETEMKVTLIHPTEVDEQGNPKPGSIVQIIGTDNMDSIVGTNPVGCIFSEYSLQNPRAWDLVRPILRENNGWAAFAYTPRGRNHGYTLYEMARKNPKWFCSLRGVDKTERHPYEVDKVTGRTGGAVLTQDDINEEIASGMDPDLVQQEFFCSFEGYTQGSYFGRYLQQLRLDKKITVVPRQTDLPVYASFDIGVDDHTAIWLFQRRGLAFYFFDYLEGRGEGLPYYKQLLDQRGYKNLDTIYWPHDMTVKEFGSGNRRIDIARSLWGLSPIMKIAKKIPLPDGIAAVRKLLPLCYFDEEHCEKGLAALAAYKHEFDEATKTFADKPEHDWASHGADSIRTLAVCVSHSLGVGGNKVSFARSNFNPIAPNPEPDAEGIAETEWDIFSIASGPSAFD